jgi:two-component system, chemotaxis family, protein-glutamate methylesterase/glutaminase
MGFAVKLTAERTGPSPVAPDIVAIASSAGGLRALSHLLAALPPEFPAALVAVQHLQPLHVSTMAEILRARIALPVHQARDGDRLTTGKVLIAPPDYHVVAQPDGTLALSHGERVHFSRPSASVLFKSVAACWGSHAIAVVLTGAGRDGVEGVTAIKHAGGTVIAQDEASSEVFGMPAAAILTGNVDLILPLDEIAGTLVRLLRPGALA